MTINELKAHILRCHAGQNNCDECDFQASTNPILIKHKNYKHNSNENHEEGAFKCDQCNLEFSAQWNLNNHTRDDHKTKTKVCSYYKQGRCQFSATSCWNLHQSKEVLHKPIQNEENKCYSCHMVFKTRQGVMKHKKLKHIEEVKECPRFIEGDCGYSDDYCWNKHTLNNPIKNVHNEGSKNSEQDFPKSPANLDPPENSN